MVNSSDAALPSVMDVFLRHYATISAMTVNMSRARIGPEKDLTVKAMNMFTCSHEFVLPFETAGGNRQSHSL